MCPIGKKKLWRTYQLLAVALKTSFVLLGRPSLFLLKPTLFCKLGAVVGSTIKSYQFLFSQTLALSLLCFLLSFLFSRTLRYIYRELSDISPLF